MSDRNPEDRGTVAALPDSDREHIESLLEYWFDSNPADQERLDRLFGRWFRSSAAVDRELEERFGGLADAAAVGRLEHWHSSARGRLALILLLDQLPRNRFRGTPAAFAQDPKALALCRDGIAPDLARELAPLERGFFYMPLQHAESRDAQAQSVETFHALAAEAAPPTIRSVLENFARYAELHRDIIERFGRFPHRNRILGRASTDAERDFLAAGGPSFGQ